MAFTGRLGTSDSRLGNIVLGSSGDSGSSSDLELTIGASASIVINLGSYLESLGLGTTAGFSLTLNSSSILTSSISGISAFSIAPSIRYNLSVAISGSSSYNILDGRVYSISVPIEGISNLGLLPGYTYTKTLDLTTVADFTILYQYIKQASISVGAIADVTLGTQYTGLATLAIPGISSAVVTQSGNIASSVMISANSKFFVEQIYNILIVSAAVSGLAVSQSTRAGNTENAIAAGSLAVSSQAVLSRSVTQTLGLTQQARYRRGTEKTAQSLTFSQTLRVNKVKSVSVSHTLGFSQDPELFRNVTNTLDLSQDISHVIAKTGNVTHTLALSQNVLLNRTVERAVTHTLTFNVPVEKRLPLVTNGRPYSFVPPLIDFVLVPRKCLVILSVPGQTVVLPCPIWGDTQSYQGTLTVKRTMRGGTKTYVRQTALEQLEYNFQLWTAKYLELRNFILNHSHKQLRLDNWKGESWIVNILNNPTEFSAESRFQPKGEQYSLQLQFEGVKIHG